MQAQLQRGYQTDDDRWRAVLDRDPASEGVFYYGVRSTGIYCRPTCPVRRPKREHVQFFAAAEAAERAGFRPCLRCRPTMVSAEQTLVAQVQRLLDTVEPTPSLAELGRSVGVSPFHLQRVFRRATGLTPRDYATTRRLAMLKSNLKHAPTVTEALYDAGFGSSRALYADAKTQLGMSPGTYRRGGAGEQIAYAVADTPLGGMLVAATDQGICALRFGERATLAEELWAELPRATLREDPEAVDEYVRAILDYLNRGRMRLDFPLALGGTAFQQRVWSALQEIPYGETRTYQEVAMAIGEPTAARAVARACATNPVALLVPCHRVLRSNGALAGYRWGLDRKRTLLNGEKSTASERRSSPCT